MSEMLVIDNIAVEGSLLTRKFACDLLKCKGACCSLPGGRGAPLLDSEVGEIETALPEILPLLSEDKRKAIAAYGFYEGGSGDYATTSLDDKDCVFVYRENCGEQVSRRDPFGGTNGIAKCAIERAYHDGKIDFQKPISCHLYPIRINSFGGDILRYHKIPECNPAVRKGENESVNVIEFVKSALIRRYGEEWYDKLTMVNVEAIR